MMAQRGAYTVVLFLGALVGWLAGPARSEPVVLAALDEPITFAYGTWDGGMAAGDGRLAIRAADGKGGGGFVILRDLSSYASRVPALRLRVGPANRAARLGLLVTDPSENAARWEFDLPEPSDGAVTLLPASGGTLSEPDSLSKGGTLDLTRCVTWQVAGDWQDAAVEVEIEAVLLLAEDDDPSVTAAREAREARAEAELRDARASVTHTPDSPWVECSYTVSPEILALSIRARDVIPGRVEPYVAQPGDELRPAGHRADLVRDGQVVAKVIGPQLDTLVFDDGIRGDALIDRLAGRPDTWTISSSDDPDYLSPVQPLRVSRKSKPVNWQHGGWGRDSFAMRHVVYLHLPQPLVEGAAYVIDCSRINLRETEHTFTYAPRETWSEAVHACQIGFRPDDPLKRGFLSVWLGTGGAQSYPDGLGFAVLDDASGEEVYRGALTIARRADETEDMWVREPRNWNYTDVLRADFAGVTTPGAYRLCVDGVGCSAPFRIADDVWEQAFVTQMRGFYNQRSGIELGPPYSEYRKPRDLHPADGVHVIQSSYRVLDGGNEGAGLEEGSTGELVPEGWGGWHDAGDWNPRRMTHMRNNVDLLLELIDMFPDYFGEVSWPLPQDYPVPAMLNEIMFEVDCFRRLQLPNGACRYGMETNGDPLDGEVSWKQTMDVYIYAPDPWSGFIYTSIAARLARLLERYDAQLAAVYADSALRAMEWSEAEWLRIRNEPAIAERWEIPDDRNPAALELYRLTKDPRWHDVFLQDTVLTDDSPEVFAWGRHVQQHAAFAYAAMPDTLADPVLKTKARAATLTMAERALAYAEGNAWGLTTSDKGRPLFQFFYSVPQAVDLVRAHYLTGDQRYLSGILQACVFPAGGNPANTTFTVGVGTEWPRNPLKVDARITGQATPIGQTVYGPLDYLHWQGDFHTWPMNQLLSQVNVPGPYEWPVPEAFYDIWIYVAQDEYTVEGFGQNAMIWGYLAARR